MTEMQSPVLWPLAAYAVAVLGLVAFMISFSALLGQRHRDRATGEPYESGITSTGTSRIRFNVKFYLIAMFFVIFDVEAVFLFAWAAALRETGWAGYVEISVFVAVLAAALVYLWRLGALEWGTGKQRRSRRSERGQTA